MRAGGSFYYSLLIITGCDANHKWYMTRANPADMASTVLELRMKLLTSIAIIMQSENCGEIHEHEHEQVLNQ